MSDLRLVRIPSGLWSLVAVPDSQHEPFKVRAAVREDRHELRRVPLLAAFHVAGIVGEAVR